MATLPAFFVLIAVSTNLDPFYFIAEDYLPHPYYRSLEMILIVPIIRFILGFVCVIEFLRFALIMVFILILATYVVISVSKLLQKMSQEVCLLFYTQLRTILALVSYHLDLFAGALIFVGQFVTILALWMILKLFGYLSVYIFACICLVAAYIILMSALLLRATSAITASTQALLQAKLDRNYVSSRCKEEKYYHFVIWRSQQSICIRAGPFFPLDREVIMAYMHHLIDNLVNVVLLIDP